MSPTNWMKHLVRLGDLRFESDEDEFGDEKPRKSEVETWIGAILQAEHLSLLLGNGFTTAQTLLAGGTPPSMASRVAPTDSDLESRIASEAERIARAAGRGSANIEDSLRVALALHAALQVLGDARAALLAASIEESITGLRTAILGAEASILAGAESVPGAGLRELTSNGYLVSFLLAFASRAPTRDRLAIFTTNYDRLIEYGCDVAGFRVLDRFVGTLNPEFRSSRVDVDYHYNPPGIRGEPRYLDGVVRLTKLHGSVDWHWRSRSIVRAPLPFGASPPPGGATDLMIYPNSAKDFETAYYPYADLFRDFSAALCRPNGALVTFGYSFGDDHINRVIADMLAIPSTHLLVIAFSDVGHRISAFVTRHAREGQVSVLLGPHYGSLENLIDEVLPAPSADGISWRRAKLMRQVPPSVEPGADRDLPD